MPGVLLANQLEAGVLEQYAQSYRHPDYESYIQTKVLRCAQAQLTSWPPVRGRCKATAGVLRRQTSRCPPGQAAALTSSRHQAPETPLHPQISFNGGAQWQDLQPPASFRHTSCNRCSQGDSNCRLHLHGPSSWYSGPGAQPCCSAGPQSLLWLSWAHQEADACRVQVLRRSPHSAHRNRAELGACVALPTLQGPPPSPGCGRGLGSSDEKPRTGLRHSFLPRTRLRCSVLQGAAQAFTRTRARRG